MPSLVTGALTPAGEDTTLTSTAAAAGLSSFVEQPLFCCSLNSLQATRFPSLSSETSGFGQRQKYDAVPEVLLFGDNVQGTSEIALPISPLYLVHQNM